jgi:hypothetical protein
MRGASRSPPTARVYRAAQDTISPERRAEAPGSIRVQTPSVHNALKSCVLNLALTEELSPNEHLSFASGISLPPKHQGERFSRKHTCYGTIC